LHCKRRVCSINSIEVNITRAVHGFSTGQYGSQVLCKSATIIMQPHCSVAYNYVKDPDDYVTMGYRAFIAYSLRRRFLTRIQGVG